MSLQAMLGFWATAGPSAKETAWGRMMVQDAKTRAADAVLADAETKPSLEPKRSDAGPLPGLG